MFYFGGSIHKYFDQSNKKDYDLYFEVLRFQEDQLQLRSYAQILYVSQITETIKISTFNSGNSNLKLFHVHSFGPGKHLGFYREEGVQMCFFFVFLHDDQTDLAIFHKTRTEHFVLQIKYARQP